jgi:hypothetical protein
MLIDSEHSMAREVNETSVTDVESMIDSPVGFVG